MKKSKELEYLRQLLNKGIFPNDKNRIWTMCQATIQMAMMTVTEAEKASMTNEQFYINFQDCLNQLSVKDPTKNNLEEFKECFNQFMADQK